MQQLVREPGVPTRHLRHKPNALLWNHTPPARRSPRPGEFLFSFVRAMDGASMTCELRFHGESYGWEAQFFEGALSCSSAAAGS
jgi:hypothetical protein